MKKIKILLFLLFISLVSYGQIRNYIGDVNITGNLTVDSIVNDQLTKNTDSLAVHLDSLKEFNTRILNNTQELDNLKEYHAFYYFQDSAVSISYSTSYANITNTANDLFTEQHATDGFTLFNDSISVTYGGDYRLEAAFVHDGDNGEVVSIIFYDVTQDSILPIPGATTMRASGNFNTTDIEANFDSMTPGDTIVIRVKGDADGTSVFKHGAVTLTRLHK